MVMIMPVRISVMFVITRRFNRCRCRMSQYALINNDSYRAQEAKLNVWAEVNAGDRSSVIG